MDENTPAFNALAVAMELLYKTTIASNAEVAYNSARLADAAKSIDDLTAAVKGGGGLGGGNAAAAAGSAAASATNAAKQTAHLQQIRDAMGRFTKQGDSGFAARLREALAGIGGRAAGGLKDKAGDVMNVLLSRFIFVLGPLALLAGLLGSASSGMGVFLSALKLLAATIAPLLLPVVAVLAAGLLQLSESLWQQILPQLEQWYTVVVNQLLPATMSLVKGFVDAVNFIRDLIPAATPGRGILPEGKTRSGKDNPNISTGWGPADWLVRNTFGRGYAFGQWAGKGATTGGEHGTGTKTRRNNSPDFAPPLPPGSVRLPDGRVVSEHDAPDEFKRAGGKPIASSGPDGFGLLMGKLMSGIGPAAQQATREPGPLAMIVQELRQSIGPKASFSGLTQASKNAQLAALNQSPIDAKLLEVNIKALELLDRVEFNTRNKGLQ